MVLRAGTRSFSFTTMSTLVTLKVAEVDCTEAEWEEVCKACQTVFAEVVAKYSRFDSKSELSKLNQFFAAGNQRPFEVSSELFQLIKQLLDLTEFSNGLFDPTVIDLLEMYGYVKTFDPLAIKSAGLPAAKLRNYLKERPSWTEIKLDEKNSTVVLAPGQRLDLGAIGKGYAMDLAVATIRKYVRNFLLEAGGDLIGAGLDPATAKPWQVSLKVRLSEQDQRYIPYQLKEQGESIAASGSWARQSGKFHHLLNPQTGLPEQKTIQTFVFGPNAGLVDGLATVLFLNGKNYLEKIEEKYNCTGLIYTSSNEIWQSKSWPEKIWLLT